MVSPFACAVLAFVGTGGLTALALGAWRPSRTQARIARLIPVHETPSEDAPSGPLAQALARSGLALTVPQLVGLWAALAVGFGLIGWAFTPHPASCVVFLAAGASIPPVWLRQAEAARRRRFAAQVPELLPLLTAALRAGHSLERAVTLAATDLPAPMREELSEALALVRLGSGLTDALRRTADRMASPDLALVTTAMALQQQSGGGLADLFERMTETLRERERLQSEIRILTAEGRLSAAILSALPLFLALAFLLRDPHYFQPLLAHPLGRLMLLGAALAEIVGVFVIRRMVRLG